MLVVLGEEREEARQRIGHRVEAGGEQHEADVEHLVPREPIAAGFGNEQEREDVVVGLGGTLVEHAASKYA